MTHARISGIGAYRPRRVVPNSEIVERIDSTDEWVQQRSGITQRTILGDESNERTTVSKVEHR